MYKYFNPPQDLFSDSYTKIIDETKKLFENFTDYIDIPLIKCSVVGNVLTGKSTLVNALLNEDILYEGKTEGTLCAAKCQLSQNQEEYFQIHEGDICLQKHYPIKQVKDINFKNKHYLKISMNTKNYLSIYLNVTKHEILEKFLLIDCPGFDDNNLNAISKYCKYADLIVFCFKAEAGITDNDIKKINEIKKNIGKFNISFIINRCDECDCIDRSKIINKLSPLLRQKDAIFFISAKEEKEGKLFNDERHREFERFKEYLQKQKLIALNAYIRVNLDLIESVNHLSGFLNFGTNRNNGFSDELFVELQKQIIQLTKENQTKYCKQDINDAFLDSSNQANTEISKFMLKQFIKDHNLSDGIIHNKYFFKRFIQNDSIPKPSFSAYEWGNQSARLKKSFIDYFTENSTEIKKSLDEYYNERAKQCLEELGIYKNELHNIDNKINRLA